MSSLQYIPNRAGALTPITQSRPLAFLLLLTTALTLGAADLYKPTYACTEDDLQWAGMSCSETEPCPIYLDISHVYPLGRKLFATGNIHSALVTLYSVFLASDDDGATWHEAFERIRGAELDRIQFVNFEAGWISGQRVTPLPGDPFLLLTTDGGKTWRKQEILPEGSAGSVQKLWFDSPRTGSLVLDRGAPDGEQMRYGKYETMTGGTSWAIRESSDKPIDLPAANHAIENEEIRMRADNSTKRLLIEKKTEGGWTLAGQFTLELAQCKGDNTPLTQPVEPDAAPIKTVAPAKDYVEELKLGPAPGEAPPKKKKPKSD